MTCRPSAHGGLQRWPFLSAQSQQCVASGNTCHSTGAPPSFSLGKAATHASGGVSVSLPPMSTSNGVVLLPGMRSAPARVRQIGYKLTTALTPDAGTESGLAMSRPAMPPQDIPTIAILDFSTNGNVARCSAACTTSITVRAIDAGGVGTHVPPPRGPKLSSTKAT